MTEREDLTLELEEAWIATGRPYVMDQGNILGYQLAIRPTGSETRQTLERLFDTIAKKSGAQAYGHMDWHTRAVSLSVFYFILGSETQASLVEDQLQGNYSSVLTTLFRQKN